MQCRHDVVQRVHDVVQHRAQLFFFFFFFFFSGGGQNFFRRQIGIVVMLCVGLWVGKKAKGQARSCCFLPLLFALENDGVRKNGGRVCRTQ